MRMALLVFMMGAFVFFEAIMKHLGIKDIPPFDILWGIAGGFMFIDWLDKKKKNNGER